MDDQCYVWPNHSVTTARENLRVANNGTWMDAFRFGKPDDTTWTLTGQTFEMDVQLNPYDTVPLLSLTTANGRIVVDDAVQRVIHFNVSAADIQSSLYPGTYVYDLVMVNASTPTQRVPLMYGTLEVIQGVTYPP
jgi:hypothetical protein